MSCGCSSLRAAKFGAVSVRLGASSTRSTVPVEVNTDGNPGWAFREYLRRTGISSSADNPGSALRPAFLCRGPRVGQMEFTFWSNEEFVAGTAYTIRISNHGIDADYSFTPQSSTNRVGVTLGQNTTFATKIQSIMIGFHNNPGRARQVDVSVR